VKEGTVAGPRVVAAGPVLSQTGGHGDVHHMPLEWVDYRTTKKQSAFASLICDGADQCRSAARYAVRENADFIKVMASGGVLSQGDRPQYRGFALQHISKKALQGGDELSTEMFTNHGITRSAPTGHGINA